MASGGGGGGCRRQKKEGGFGRERETTVGLLFRRAGLIEDMVGLKVEGGDLEVDEEDGGGCKVLHACPEVIALHCPSALFADISYSADTCYIRVSWMITTGVSLGT